MRIKGLQSLCARLGWNVTEDETTPGAYTFDPQDGGATSVQSEDEIFSTAMEHIYTGLYYIPNAQDDEE